MSKEKEGDNNVWKQADLAAVIYLERNDQKMCLLVFKKCSATWNMK